MSNFKQRTLDFLEIEWATYIERFNRWPVAEGRKRVNDQGYEKFRDMLAHILAWWEEGMGIILAIAEEREYERKKYDFDVFNAEAVKKYKTWDEAEFLAHFEKTRQKAATSLRTMNEAAWENKRVRTWVNGIFIDHAREHLVALSRFLLLDTLQIGWATYVDDFEEEHDHLEILSMILPTAQYRRDIVKAGVKADKVVAEKTFLLTAFEKEALFYFEREDFPERYVRKLYKELEKGLSAKRAIRKNDSEEFQ